MYDQYYGFTGRPFQLTPDPAFYFESLTHRKAMSYLGYGLAQGEGFIVITGDIGAGKTTLVGHLMATVDPRRLNAVQIVSTQVGGDDMLRLAAQGFGIDTDGLSKAQTLTRFEAMLHQQARAGKRALLIVDEAQNLSTGALEELRMLSNFQLGGQSLLQIFLLGQPEFRNMIRGEARLEQLRQRVIATHHLEPMQPEEVAPYIEHRLRVVGWTGTPRFTAEAYALLADASDGVPRRLNALVSRVLLLGAIDRLDMIDARVVEAVIADTGQETGTDALAVSAPAEPEAVAPADVVAPVEPAIVPVSLAEPDLADLHALHGEVRTFNAALTGVDATPDEPAAEPETPKSIPPQVHAFDSGQIADFQTRLEALEQQAQEQDEVLRRILGKLIEWAERDAQDGPFARRTA